MGNLADYLVFLIPIAIVEVALAAAALIHIFRHNKYRFGNRILWILIVCCIQIIGPVVYFTVGKGEE